MYFNGHGVFLSNIHKDFKLQNQLFSTFSIFKKKFFIVLVGKAQFKSSKKQCGLVERTHDFHADITGSSPILVKKIILICDFQKKILLSF